MPRRLIAFVLFCALTSCTTIPIIEHEVVERARPVPHSGPLVQASQEVVRGGADSHFMLLNNAEEALKWRLALIDSARSSLDIQTFMWESDDAGALLFDRVLRAADRGVRVRLLVDDIWFESDEQAMAAIDAHPNLSMRLYNPSRVRGGSVSRAMYFLTNYKKMNRRMHNKTFIADGVFAINGGRNLGGKYFGLSKKYNFRDLDVLTTGPVLSEVREEFDLFWNSAYAYPAKYLSDEAESYDVPSSLKRMRKVIVRHEDGLLKSYPIRVRDWGDELKILRNEMVSGQAHFVGDDPYGRERIVVDYVTEALANAQSEITIISPYFIPYANRFDGVDKLIERGVKVNIVVPSLGANNHTPAHSHYRKYRKAILDAGCSLYEYHFQPDAGQRALCDVEPVRASFIGMHMKAVIIDRRVCFIGSLNMDPRAMDINTEEGMFIESEELTKQMLEIVEAMTLPANAWKLEQTDRGRIQWRGECVLTRQPARNEWQRIIDAITRWIPIESEL
ncbi:phospholipase D family protein [Rubritalea tangerina]|uniref:Phospholipase D family protein n=1 Tax=Rubritalea tangerina TaxID=430798 RepID=A0ABW4ZE13_9BACT